jgi:RNA polymerase sigma factor (sigma-70 family)
MAVVVPELGGKSRVYLVDDDAPVRASLEALFEAHRIDCTGAANGQELLAILDPEVALCVFVDIRMPGMDGLELQRLMRDRGIATPVIFLTAHGDVPLAVEAMKRGALDFIEKPASEEQLLDAVEAARSHYANQARLEVAKGVVGERLAKLTARERQVLDHLVLGMTNKHIADELGISQRTVEIHRSRIREKMEARGLADLIRMVK